MVEYQSMTVMKLIVLLMQLLRTGRVKPQTEVYLSLDDEGNGFARVSADTRLSLEVDEKQHYVVLYPSMERVEPQE